MCNLKTNYVKWNEQHGNHKAENYCVMVVDLVQSYKPMGCNFFVGAFFFYSRLDYFTVNLQTVSNEHGEHFTRTFPPWQSGTKTSVPVCWLIIAGHLGEKFHRQNIAGSDPVLLCM
jgi:hypothetical protein